jgi:hypothetical protein
MTLHESEIQTGRKAETEVDGFLYYPSRSSCVWRTALRLCFTILSKSAQVVAARYTGVERSEKREGAE